MSSFAKGMVRKGAQLRGFQCNKAALNRAMKRMMQAVMKAEQDQKKVLAILAAVRVAGRLLRDGTPPGTVAALGGPADLLVRTFLEESGGERLKPLPAAEAEPG